MFVGHALHRHDGAVTPRKAIHRSGTNAARGGAAGNDHGIDLVPYEQRLQWRLEEGRRHTLGVDDILRLNLGSLIEGGTVRTILDVLQRVGSIGAGAPYSGVLCGVEESDIRPHHRPAELAKAAR